MGQQEYETPQDALAHYGVKGMKWGVRKDDRAGSQASGPSDAGSASLLATYAVVIGGAHIARRTILYLDSGKPIAKKIAREERKSGEAHEWAKKESLAGPKTVAQLEKDVIPAINVGHPDAPGTSMNCRRCTFAYEMRRRGYDVAATKSMFASGQDAEGVATATMPDATSRQAQTKAAKNANVWGSNLVPTTVGRTQMTPEGKSRSLFDTLGKQPDGSRGELGFGWIYGGGHSVAYEIVNNRPVIFCTQTKKKFLTPESFAGDFGAVMTEAAFTRLDNVELNHEFLRRWVTDAK